MSATSAPPTVTVRRLTTVTEQQVEALAELTRDVVHAGASFGFMAPMSREAAVAFWRVVADGVASGTRALLVAESASDGDVVGSVQLILGLPENQPQPADLAKMMVHPRARRQGLAARLLRAAEALASSANAPCWCSTPSPVAMPNASTLATDGSGAG